MLFPTTGYVLCFLKGDPCDYEQNITAIVGKENIIGTQFHPEKSQKNGIEILKNFINWVY